MKAGRLALLLVRWWTGACALGACAAALAQPALSAGGTAFPGETLFFPPTAPIFGEPIADEPPAALRPHIPPPLGLADFVGDTFYPALSSRLYDRLLARRLEERLDAYRSERSALLNELVDRISVLEDADPHTRAARLEALAAEQAPRITALEEEAEALRRDLISGTLLDRNVDWRRERRWVVGRTRFDHEALEKEAEFQVVRAAAYYQSGLLIEQRGLLLEIAVELRERARASRPVPPPKTEDAAAMFFSPAMSRLRLPRKLPPELVRLIGRFNQEKEALKTELREAILGHDASPSERRAQVCAELAELQWPRFAPLERLAEEIRYGLAALPSTPIAAPPHLPPTLLKRINAYMQQRQRFIQAFNETIKRANESVQPPPVDRRMTADQRVHLARQLAEARTQAREQAAEQFRKNTEKAFTTLRAEFDEIQVALGMVAAAQFDPETGQPLTPDTLLRNYNLAMDRFDAFGREEVIYRQYRHAMLMPGLSPEQRRLLFNAALIGLAQPLPWGEPFPNRRMPVPRS